ncbi:uncharacterized protein LOC110847205 [Folsomia candida]|uniref:Apple domain-containing protein n=1 Tax=Folsomia candida TaxID=158441 RepID=A0A226EIX0_FOLCA|nr:uncharacterized protein LOC110847205 [Folsomia candida]OXA57057.1 hypothetical protein Fcan01_06459 [Folsomia candida]
MKPKFLFFATFVFSFYFIDGTQASIRIKRSINWNGNNWAMKCDFNGNNLSNVKISSDKCGGKCAETTGCTHFTWTNYNGGTCWMKSGNVSPNDAFETSDSSMVCGYMQNPVNGDVIGTKYSGVLATRHAATKVGACQLPEADYASGIHPVALGDISSLGNLKFKPGLCGHILRVDCGHGSVDIVVNNANLGGGLDLYSSSWDLATGHKPPGQDWCSVQATTRNLFSNSGPRCYYNPSSEMNNDYYHQLGLFNVGGKVVDSANLGGHQGSWNSITGYFSFDGGPVGRDATVTFKYTDGSSFAVLLNDCKKVMAMHTWS